MTRGLETTKRKVEEKPNKIQSCKRSRQSITYSDKIEDCIKTFCCGCDKAVTISGLKVHIQKHHQMSFDEYEQLYGNPRAQIIKMVYHNCGMCGEDLLLDIITILKHVRRFHQMEFNEYYSKFFLVEVNKTRSVIISCTHCSKTFKKNIQLKFHIREHHNDATNTSKLGGSMLLVKTKI